MADSMTSQMEAELAFWKGLVADHGANYYAYRISDLGCRGKTGDLS